MSLVETPVEIAGVSGRLIGVATQAARVCDVAVLIVPAPGETRTGPDRLYVRLARELGRAGLPSLRFDPCDGGDSAPTMGGDARFDEDAVAAARHLLKLHPDSYVAVLAAGRGAAGAARAWHALAEAALPLSALCLVDPRICAGAGTIRAEWWRRLLGLRAPAVREPSIPATDVPPADADLGDAPLWHALPAAVRAARSKLLLAVRGDEQSNAEVFELVSRTRTWNKALRRSRGWLQLKDADPGFTHAASWHELTEFLARRLAG